VVSPWFVTNAFELSSVTATSFGRFPTGTFATTRLPYHRADRRAGAASLDSYAKRRSGEALPD
jgi:hypothetical protein